MVESIDHVPLVDITDARASLEGCTADELRAGLRAGHYPDLADDDAVDFVRFRVTVN